MSSSGILPQMEKYMAIKEWNDIKTNYTEALLLGNGASISIDTSFAYGSLKQHAIDHGYFTEEVQALFDSFHTEDFELVLRIVWHAYFVNKALGIEDNKTTAAYEAIRDSLINAVRSIHVDYNSSVWNFPAIYEFTKGFDTICSLNYDLTLYWACMYGNDIKDGHGFKDCFFGRGFDEEWGRFRDPIRGQNKCTLLFYPHGNLVFARDKIENERKISSGSGDLLETILEKWLNGSYVPLFVSEGTSEQKIKSIQSSYYLSTIYREVLPELGKSLVIYGWGFGEHDVHIINRICVGGTRIFAVSVYPDGNEEAYCNRVTQIIKDACNRENVEIVFFNAKSKGCWCNE